MRSSMKCVAWLDAPVACASELGVQVQLQGVDALRDTEDLIRAQVSQPGKHALGEGHVRRDEVALRVGAAEVEVRIREGVERGVGLQVAISEAHAPGARLR